MPEGRANDAWGIPPLVETEEDVRAGLNAYQTWVGHVDGRLVISGRARVSPQDSTIWELGRLMVAPDLASRGLGRELIGFLEAQAPTTTRTAWMNTGERSARNLRLYARLGYRQLRTPPRYPGTIELTKPLR